MADNEDLDEFESEEDVGQREQGAKHPADSDGHEDEEEEEEEEEEEAQPPGTKKKRLNLPQDWKEVKR